MDIVTLPAVLLISLGLLLSVYLIRAGHAAVLAEMRSEIYFLAGGLLVTTLSVFLPFMGNEHGKFLYYGIDGPTHFGSSGGMDIVTPPAMLLISLGLLLCVHLIRAGRAAVLAGKKWLWAYKTGRVLGIISAVLLLLWGYVWPLFTWHIMGRPYVIPPEVLH